MKSPEKIDIKYPQYHLRFSPLFNQLRVYSALSHNFYYWMSLLSRVDKIGSVDISSEIPVVKVQAFT